MRNRGAEGRQIVAERSLVDHRDVLVIMLPGLVYPSGSLRSQVKDRFQDQLAMHPVCHPHSSAQRVERYLAQLWRTRHASGELHR
jgi:hypothetical protein